MANPPGDTTCCEVRACSGHCKVTGCWFVPAPPQSAHEREFRTWVAGRDLAVVHMQARCPGVTHSLQAHSNCPACSTGICADRCFIQHHCFSAVSLQLAKTPTCGDTDVTRPGNQAWTCPLGSKMNSSSMAAGPPSDATCCLVSFLCFRHPQMMALLHFPSELNKQPQHACKQPLTGVNVTNCVVAGLWSYCRKHAATGT
jgi:hypothetical protein